MSVLGIDHVQYCFPPGGLERARAFWRDVMCFKEIARPATLAARLEGTWFLCGKQQIHLGAEPDFRPAKKGHAALYFDDLPKLLDRLKAAGYEVLGSEDDIPGVELRAFSWDAFGNRIELLQLKASSATSHPSHSPALATALPTEPATVVLLGDPRLRQRSAEVTDFASPLFQQNCALLARTLLAFREQHGFGRAISAPQIGIAQRFIAVNLGRGVFFVVNPVYTHKSVETFTMWDDCMSFPDLLVKVRRHRSVSLSYVDHEGKTHEWERLDQATAELLQHEIDHLDGVLAVDRALSGVGGEGNALVMKAVYEKNKEHFRREVDYVIGELLMV